MGSDFKRNGKLPGVGESESGSEVGSSFRRGRLPAIGEAGAGAISSGGVSQGRKKKSKDQEVMTKM